MPDESEVIQADWSVEFSLPNGKALRGKPVVYPTARKIMAALHAFDRSGNYERDLVPALDLFSEASGITEEMIMAACPDLHGLGELTTSIQRFFFRRRPISASAAASIEKYPESTRPRPGEPGA